MSERSLEPVQSANGRLVPEDTSKNVAGSGAAQRAGSEVADNASARNARFHSDFVSNETEAETAATAADVSPSPDIPSSAIEIELKLLVDADRLADFGKAPVIAANARDKGSRKHLKAVYYDTPKRALQRNGLSFRVRQSGARFTQTVKAVGNDKPELYDLAADIGETKDLSSTKPEIQKDLQTRYDAWNKTLVEPRWQAPNAAARAAKKGQGKKGKAASNK